MAARFNDPDDSCKVLVATDAIGMGLNLNIRRLVFYSLQKLTMDPDNPSEKSMDVISVSQALQIAGRAGRFNTQWETGYVTCYHEEDMELMHSLLSQTPPEILQAGLHPTFDQVCTFRPFVPIIDPVRAKLPIVSAGPGDFFRGSVAPFSGEKDLRSGTGSQKPIWSFMQFIKPLKVPS